SVEDRIELQRYRDLDRQTKDRSDQEMRFLTLPSECVSLNRPGFEDLIHPRHRRGGGNVGIGFIDFQGLWEGRKTALSFSGFPTNRHFHGLLRSPRTLRRRSSP